MVGEVVAERTLGSCWSILVRELGNVGEFATTFVNSVLGRLLHNIQFSRTSGCERSPRQDANLPVRAYIQIVSTMYHTTTCSFHSLCYLVNPCCRYLLNEWLDADMRRSCADALIRSERNLQ